MWLRLPAGTADEHLLTPWRFLLARKVVSEQPRHIVLRDAVSNHLVHHGGQLTACLRLDFYSEFSPALASRFRRAASPAAPSCLPAMLPSRSITT